MDIATIASAAIGFVAPYLKKGGEAITAGMGKDLWELIKKPFKKDSQKASVKEMEEKPNDPVVQGKLIGKLEEELENDAEYAKALQELVKKVGDQQNNNTNIQNITGDNNISVQGTQNSQVNINK